MRHSPYKVKTGASNDLRRSIAVTLSCTAIVVAALLRAVFSPAHDTAFEIASWNMRWFPSGYTRPQEPERELDRIAKTALILRKQGVPDIFFAQEIRDFETCVLFAERLNDPAFKPVVCSEFADAGDLSNNMVGLQQIAIFSRFRALESGAEAWHTADFVSPPRGYAYAVLEIGTNLVAVFNVHLKSNFIPQGQDVARQTTLNRLKRELSCRQLLDAAAALLEKNFGGRRVAGVILGGDFNHSFYDPRFDGENSIRALLAEGFQNAFEDCSGDDLTTVQANQWYPAATFDYILCDGGLLVVKGSQKVFTEPFPFGISDHRRIRVKMKMK